MKNYLTHNVKNIQPLNENGKRHGYWLLYWSDDTIWFNGNYINGKKDGYWVINEINGNISKQYYIV